MRLPLLLCTLAAQRSQATEDVRQTKVLFSEELAASAAARCLDGSPAGYYLKVRDRRRWVVFLQGGGICTTRADCWKRSRTALGSSTQWGPAKKGYGPWSDGPGALFSRWSKAYVPYCSGDVWTGRGRERHRHSFGLQMSGHHILDAVVDHLVNTTAFGLADTVVFAGTSAGGIGVFQHADWMLEKLRGARGGPAPRFAALPFAGVYFPRRWPAVYETFFPPAFDGLVYASWASRYERFVVEPFVHAGCARAMRGRHESVWHCLNVGTMMRFVRSPLFLAQEQFDQNQINGEGLCPPSACSNATDPKSRAGQFIAYFGEQMNATLHALASERPETGLYVSNLFNHDSFLMDWAGGAGYGYSIEGLSLQEAFNAWFLHGKKVQLFAGACGGRRGPCPAGPGAGALAAGPGMAAKVVTYV